MNNRRKLPNETQKRSNNQTFRQTRKIFGNLKLAVQ